MPNKFKIHVNESAASVFADRKKDVLDRIAYLHGIVDKFNPTSKDRDTISDLDYILDSLDDVIKDTKERTGLTDVSASTNRKYRFSDGSVIKASCKERMLFYLSLLIILIWLISHYSTLQRT